VTNLTRQFVEEGWYWSICPEADNLSALKDSIKNRSFSLVPLNPGTSCALATPPLRLDVGHICLKNRSEKRLGGDGIAFAHLDGSSALIYKRWNGSSCLSQLSETFKAGLMDTLLGRARNASMKAEHKSQFRRDLCDLHDGPDSKSAGMGTNTR
jgi:hypothetical protein